MEDVARVAVYRRVDECANEFMADQERVTMFAVVLGRDAPYIVLDCALERFAERSERGRRQRGAIDGSDHGGVAVVLENGAKANLQRAELAAAGIGIADHVGATGAGNLGDRVSILAGDDNDGSGVGLEGKDRGGEQRVAGGSGIGASWRPGKKRFVGSHARRLAGSKNDAAEAEGVLHA